MDLRVRSREDKLSIKRIKIVSLKAKPNLQYQFHSKNGSFRVFVVKKMKSITIEYFKIIDTVPLTIKNIPVRICLS